MFFIGQIIRKILSQLTYLYYDKPQTRVTNQLTSHKFWNHRKFFLVYDDDDLKLYSLKCTVHVVTLYWYNFFWEHKLSSMYRFSSNVILIKQNARKNILICRTLLLFAFLEFITNQSFFCMLSRLLNIILIKSIII